MSQWSRKNDGFSGFRYQMLAKRRKHETKKINYLNLLSLVIETNV